MTRHTAADVAAFLERDNEGQVYARDVRTQEVAYMAAGRVEDFRAETTAALFVCPLPTCAAPLVAHGAAVRRHHWKHRPGTIVAAAHRPETFWHLTGKEIIAAWARQQQPDAHVEVEKRLEPTLQRPDVLVTWPEGDSRIGFEIQYSGISPTTFDERRRARAAAGVRDIWLFGHAEPHCSLWGAGVAVVRITSVVLRLCDELTPLLWLNVDRQEVMTGYVLEDVQLPPASGELWDGEPPTVTRWRYPTPDDAQVNVGIDRLDECRLTIDGLTTPTMDMVADGRVTALAEEDRLRAAARARHDEHERRRLAERAAEDEHERRRREEREAAAQRPNRYGPEVPRRAASAAQPEGHFRVPVCTTCRGELTDERTWPSWYRPPVHATHVRMCASCGLPYGKPLRGWTLEDA